MFDSSKLVKTYLSFSNRKKQRKIKLDCMNISVCTRSELPEDVEIIVFEEDTFLSLTPENQLYYPKIRNNQLACDFFQPASYPIGSVIPNGRSWNAVVADFWDRNLFSHDGVSKAYANIFRMALENKVGSIGMQLLGNVWGAMPNEIAVKLALMSMLPFSNKNNMDIWMLVSNESKSIVSREFVSQSEVFSTSISSSFLN